jgi:hypothetical protein
MTFSLVTSVMNCSAGDPIVIASGKGLHAPKQPQAAIGRDGDVHLVHGIGNAVFYSRSENGGAKFTEPQPAFQVPNMSLGMRRGPRIVSVGSAIVITAIGGQVGKGRDGDVLSWRSEDGGTTWKGPVRVNDVVDSAREGLHAMASGSDDSIWCVWLDLRDKKTEVYAAVSRDKGTTWEPNICVYRSPDGSVCECCHPSVIVSGESIHVMFRNSLDGNRDMYVTSSDDRGKSFSEAKKLGTGTWTLDACPMDGGMLAVGSKGTLETAWRRDGHIYFATGDGSREVQLGAGQQPWIAGTSKGSFIVWTTGRDGHLMLKSQSTEKAQTLAETARDPVVVAAAHGSGSVMAFWESKHGDTQSIMAVRLDEGR